MATIPRRRKPNQAKSRRPRQPLGAGSVGSRKSKKSMSEQVAWLEQVRLQTAHLGRPARAQAWAEHIIRRRLGDGQSHFQIALVYEVERMAPAWVLAQASTLPRKAPIAKVLTQAARRFGTAALQALEHNGLIERVQREGKTAWRASSVTSGEPVVSGLIPRTPILGDPDVLERGGLA